MLRLTNITRSNGFVSANYHPEAEKESGFVKISIADGEIAESKATQYDSPINIYLSHAAKALDKYRHSKDVPATELVMWH